MVEYKSKSISNIFFYLWKFFYCCFVICGREKPQYEDVNNPTKIKMVRYISVKYKFKHIKIEFFIESEFNSKFAVTPKYFMMQSYYVWCVTQIFTKIHLPLIIFLLGRSILQHHSGQSASMSLMFFKCVTYFAVN